MRTLVAALAALAAGACTQPDRARQALEDAGYVGVRAGGYIPFGCSDDDNFATGFTAIAPSGQCVRGVVCAGMLKGAVIRTFGHAETCAAPSPKSVRDTQLIREVDHERLGS